MGRQVIPGENVSDMRTRWKAESEREKLLRREKEILRKEKIKDAIERAKERVKLGIERRKPRIQVPPKPIIMPLPIDYIPGDKKLSVLICSITSRKILLQNLVEELKRQSIDDTNDVEILVEMNNKEITTGAKRNLLLKKARGDYICFIDDDDRVSKDYIVKILEAIKSNPDCCSLEGHLRRRIRTVSYTHLTLPTILLV